MFSALNPVESHGQYNAFCFGDYPSLDEEREKRIQLFLGEVIHRQRLARRFLMRTGLGRWATGVPGDWAAGLLGYCSISCDGVSLVGQ